MHVYIDLPCSDSEYSQALVIPVNISRITPFEPTHLAIIRALFCFHDTYGPESEPSI